jgi:ankyrin repeat protein
LPHTVCTRLLLLALPCGIVGVLWFAAQTRSWGDNGDFANAPDGLALTVHEAARTGDLDALERLLARQPDALDAREPGVGLTPMMTAARAGQLQVVRRLLWRGASAHVSVPGYGTPLSIAVWNNQSAIAEALLAAGADPDAGTPDGHTPLMFAARNADDDPRGLDLLLAAGADTNVHDAHGNTALALALGSHNAHTAAHLRAAAGTHREPARAVAAAPNTLR